MVRVWFSVALAVVLLAGVACSSKPKGAPAGAPGLQRGELGLSAPIPFLAPRLPPRPAVPVPVEPRPEFFMEAGRAGPTPTPAPTPSPPPGAAPPGGAEQASALGPPGQPQAVDRMVIRTGSVSLVVESTPKAVERITRLAGDMGGHVVSSKMWEEGRRVVGSISIRVPADLFFDAVKALRALSVIALSEDSTSRDVTEEFVDLDSRLRHLQATEQQLLKLLEKATRVEEALAVQKELGRIQGEIEQAKGRQQYLQRSSATSLISITLREAALEPQFTTTAIKVRAGEQIQFQNRTKGGFPPYSFSWDLGDGTTTTEENPAHAYSKPGTYTVSLTVTDDKANTATETKKAFLTIQPIEAEFSASLSEAPVGVELQFTNLTQGGFAPKIYSWDFGDGTTSDREHPKHTYPRAGTFTVSLRVTDDKGNTDDVSKKGLVLVTAPPRWQAGGVARDAAKSLGALARGLATAGIWLAVFIPVWGPILVGYWVMRSRNRRLPPPPAQLPGE